MSVIGYIRVSSTKQTCEHQRYEIAQFAKKNATKIDIWVKETISSRKSLAKRKLGSVLANIQKGDILIATEISRLGRSMIEVMRILEECLNKGCQVWTIKENYHLGNDIQSKVMAFAFGLSAEIERNLISQRTKASLDSIRAKGHKLGRPFAAESKKLKLKKSIARICSMLNRGVPKAKIARALRVQTSTLRRFMARALTVQDGICIGKQTPENPLS